MMGCVLKDLIEISKDGEWGKGEPCDSSVEMLAIRGTDFERVRFGDTASTPRRFIPKRIAERKTLRPWDVLIEAAGGTKNQITGRTVLLRPELFSRSELPFTCASFSRFIRFKTELCDPQFMFWYLQHLYASGSMHAYHTQHTGVARFQWTTFSERESLEIPPLPVQRRIAGILSAYDCSIANNIRRIQILEQMAQALYREWFVDFRFPRHTKVKLVASRLGKIPNGWRALNLGDVVELAYGKALKAEQRLDGPYAVYGSSGVVGWHNEALVKAPGVVVGRKGNVGSVFWSDVDFYPIDTVYFVRSEVPLHYIFYNLNHQTFQNNDAAVPGLNRNAAYMKPFILPDSGILAAFQNFAEPVFNQLRILNLKNSNLRRTRNLLLPKLISGVLSVENMEAVA